MNEALINLLTRLDDMAVALPRLQEVSGCLKQEIQRLGNVPEDHEGLERRNTLLSSRIAILEGELQSAEDELAELRQASWDFQSETEEWLRRLYDVLCQHNPQEAAQLIQANFWHNGKTLPRDSA